MTFPHISLYIYNYIYINIYIYINKYNIYTSPSPPHFFLWQFPMFFLLVSPKTELDSKFQNRTVWRHRGWWSSSTVIITPRAWRRPIPTTGRCATRELGKSDGESGRGRRWKAILLWKTWNNTFRNPRFHAYDSERGINFKNYGGSRFYSWSRTSICARNWWCWPFTIDRAVTSSV